MHAKQFGPSPGLVTLRLLNPSRAKESFASSPRRSARPFCSCVPISPKSLTPPHMIPTSFQGPLGPEPNIPGNSRSRAHGVARNPWDSGRKPVQVAYVSKGTIVYSLRSARRFVKSCVATGLLHDYAASIWSTVYRLVEFQSEDMELHFGLFYLAQGCESS